MINNLLHLKILFILQELRNNSIMRIMWLVQRQAGSSVPETHMAPEEVATHTTFPLPPCSLCSFIRIQFCVDLHLNSLLPHDLPQGLKASSNPHPHTAMLRKPIRVGHSRGGLWGVTETQGWLATDCKGWACTVAERWCDSLGDTQQPVLVLLPSSLPFLNLWHFSVP